MISPTAMTGDGGLGPSSEFLALRSELDEAVTAFPEMEELKELVAAMDMMQQMAQDPAYATSVAEAAMKDYVPNPPIFDAIDDGDVAAVEDALKSWEVNATHGEFDSTALYHAMSCMFGVSLPVVGLLLDRGADPSLGLGRSSNVLHGLGFGQCNDLRPEDLSAIIRRCMSLGADIEQRSNKLGWTPLITAASEWNPVAVEALLLAGADIHARAGEVDGVCFSGEPALAFADGDAKTKAVLERFLNKQ